MSFLDEYVRVDENQPCPKCGRIDWCAVHRSGLKCVCTRIESGKRYGGAGWLHYLPDDLRVPELKPKPKEYLPPVEVKRTLESLATPRKLMEHQAHHLGVSIESLLTMQAKYDGAKAALVFPMFNERGKTVGLRYRRSDGRKWALKGGREGIFLSVGFHPKRPIVLTEGPTDAAALCWSGFDNVIGRPSCTGGTKILQAIMKKYSCTPMLILADPDAPGRNGATSLASELPNPCRVLIGPDDVRGFVQKIGLQSDCRCAILEGVSDCEYPTWEPVFTNNPGTCFPFSRYFEATT